jgi:His/Glu/Gln/Arg/opine family amino acid ABC transporter permease subunit
MLALLPSWVDPTAHYIIHEGLTNTLKIAAGALVGSLVVGLVLGVLLTLDFLPTRALIRLYIEVWRGLPIIVTLFMIYYFAPTISPRLTFYWSTAGIIGLTLWGSAQVAEATRGAVASIPREQHEAASALGFGWVGRHVFVVLPQALRRLLPPLVTLLVGIIQNTTLVAVIGGSDLLGTAIRQNERLASYPPIGIGQIKAFEILGVIMVAFFVISFPLTRLSAYLERRLV